MDYLYIIDTVFTWTNRHIILVDITFPSLIVWLWVKRKTNFCLIRNHQDGGYDVILGFIFKSSEPEHSIPGTVQVSCAVFDNNLFNPISNRVKEQIRWLSAFSFDLWIDLTWSKFAQCLWIKKSISYPSTCWACFTLWARGRTVLSS